MHRYECNAIGACGFQQFFLSFSCTCAHRFWQLNKLLAESVDRKFMFLFAFAKLVDFVWMVHSLDWLFSVSETEISQNKCAASKKTASLSCSFHMSRSCERGDCVLPSFYSHMQKPDSIMVLFERGDLNKAEIGLEGVELWILWLFSFDVCVLVLVLSFVCVCDTHEQFQWIFHLHRIALHSIATR